MPFSKRWDRTLNVLSFIAFNHAVLRDCKQWRWENVMLHNRSSVLVLVFLFSYGFKHPTLFEYAEFVVVGTGEEALFTCVCVCIMSEQNAYLFLYSVRCWCQSACQTFCCPREGFWVPTLCWTVHNRTLFLVVNREVQNNFRTKNRIHGYVQVWLHSLYSSCEYQDQDLRKGDWHIYSTERFLFCPGYCSFQGMPKSVQDFCAIKLLSSVRRWATCYCAYCGLCYEV